MGQRRQLLANVLVLCVLSALIAWSALQPTRARACGGLFCSNNAQVNQVAERIVFAQNADGQVTMLVEIAYEGPSHQFAWLLPVSGEPTIGVSSTVALQRLQSATDPTYTLNMRVEGRCDGDEQLAIARRSGSGTLGDFANDESGPHVDVRAEGSVGPYDYVLISVADATAMDDPTQLALDWLSDNSYDVTATAPELLRPYLEDGLNLLAFKLSSGSDTGSIRPVTLTFEAGLPSIPIRPTAVAANEDMGVMVWMVGDGRAIPKNYKHLELNEALINWFNPNATYNQVVSMAADEAEGQGFVTEFAGPGDDLAERVYGDFERDEWERVSTTQYSFPSDAFAEANNAFFGWDGFDQAVMQALDAAGVEEYSAADVTNCAACVLDAARVEPAIVLDAIFESVIEPVQEAAALLTSAPRVTRLYTTMSADEMTLDPVFDLNDELPDYSNQHSADWVIECDPSVTMDEALWRIELKSGDVRGGEQDWPIALGDAPATQRILQLGTRGAGTLVIDNSDEIAAVVARSNKRYPSVGGCACSTTGASNSGRAPWLATLLLLGLCTGRVLRRRG